MTRKKDKLRKSAKANEALTRRDFLKGAGVAVSGGLLAGKEPTAAASPGEKPKVLGPEAVPITLRINGKAQKLTLEPRVTLLDALRDHLDMTGTKKMCDRGTCGACTVILDGKAVYACSLLAIVAQGKEILTIEGLAAGGKLHPVMTAFVEHDAHQCGFCTPGFVVAAKAFLDKNPNPTVLDIEKGLGGNLCRCGVYVGVRQAALEAAKALKGGKAHGKV
jgi:xanthine dehydrogenase YagT iron-sulfur-binding subunit